MRLDRCQLYDAYDVMHRWIWIIELSLIHDAEMKMVQCGFFDIWCIVRLIIIVLSWLIRYTNGWTPNWSPYGEIPHGKTLCRLSYPRSMVRETMLICGIMRWTPVNFLVKLSYMYSYCHSISDGMWNIT